MSNVFFMMTTFISNRSHFKCNGTFIVLKESFHVAYSYIVQFSNLDMGQTQGVKLRRKIEDVLFTHFQSFREISWFMNHLELLPDMCEIDKWNSNDVIEPEFNLISTNFKFPTIAITFHLKSITPCVKWMPFLLGSETCFCDSLSLFSGVSFEWHNVCTVHYSSCGTVKIKPIAPMSLVQLPLNWFLFYRTCFCNVFINMPPNNIFQSVFQCAIWFLCRRFSGSSSSLSSFSWGVWLRKHNGMRMGIWMEECCCHVSRLTNFILVLCHTRDTDSRTAKYVSSIVSILMHLYTSNTCTVWYCVTLVRWQTHITLQIDNH